MKLRLLLITLFICSFAMAQNKATVSGVLTDKEANNATLPFANAMIKGTSIGTTTDENGKYTLKVDAGSYTIVFSFLGYENVEQNFTVAAGETATINKALGSGSYTLNDVTVQAAVKNREKEAALLLDQKNAVEIKQSIGAQEMTRKGVSDAAAAVTKVTGISKQEGSSGIFVRGLGDRYNSTTLNGLPLPSNEPTNKNVALDLFSTDVIQSIGVSKTYYTDMNGDVGGANINIVSKEHTGKGKLNIEIGSGLNNNAFAANFRVADGIEKSGFYNVSKPTTLNNYPFQTKWVPNYESQPVDMNFGLSGGTAFNIGESSKLSVFATASFENGYSLKTGSQRIIGNTNDNVIQDFYKVNKFEYGTKTTAMLNLAYKINANHNVKFNSVFVNSSKSDVNEYDFTNDNGSPSFTRQTITEQNKLFVNQLLGTNKITDRIDFNWGASFGTVTSDMPDRLTNVLVEGASGLVFNTNSQSMNNRYFQNLEENETSAKALFNVKLFKGEGTDYKGKLTVGYNAKIKSRDFEATQINFRVNGTVTTTPDAIDDFLNPTNQAAGNTANTFTILTARNAGSLNPFTYNADLSVHSGLANFEYVPSEKITFTLGLRADKVLQEMEWNTNIDLPNVNFDDAKIDKFYLLPVATLKYSLNDKQNLRVAASKTYTLPQFIEKAPFRFEVIGESTVGNAFLKPSENYNLDIKWEMFPGEEELFSVTAFGKYLIDPISKTRLNSSLLNDNTFVNAGDNAFVAGAELEIRKNIWAVEDKSALSFGANFTYMYSEQKLDSEKVDTETNHTLSVSFNGTKDALQGASPFLANADITYRIESGSFRPTVSLVGNYFHDRIYALGNIQNGGNVVEKGIPTLNFISSAAIGKRLTATFHIKNLLDSKIERFQENTDGDATIYSYKTGLDFSLGLKYSLF